MLLLRWDGDRFGGMGCFKAGLSGQQRHRCNYRINYMQVFLNKYNVKTFVHNKCIVSNDSFIC